MSAEINPNLKEAMTEVQAVCKRFDIGGVIILSDGDGHSEYRLVLAEPTWSLLKFTDEGKFNIQGSGELLRRTCDLLVHLTNVTSGCQGFLSSILNQVKAAVGITTSDEAWLPGPRQE